MNTIFSESYSTQQQENNINTLQSGYHWLVSWREIHQVQYWEGWSWLDSLHTTFTTNI
jgi:hypothetical protein